MNKLSPRLRHQREKMRSTHPSDRIARSLGQSTRFGQEQLPSRSYQFQPATNPNRKLRIALYSHDTMGLGHKRRNLSIAQALGASALDADILMISGMSEANDLSMSPGVDSLTLPALYKNSDGEYKSRRLDISLAEIINLRSQVIQTTLATFGPDVLIVDNVARGAMGELDATLEYLRDRQQTYCILGLRDVLDEPSAVRRDWQHHHNDRVIREYYDAVWVYGDRSAYDLSQEYDFAPETNAKLHYLGYLDRTECLKFVDEASKRAIDSLNLPSSARLILCAVGGGQDGAELAEVFARTEFPADTHGILLTGPFMPQQVRQRLQQQADERSDLSLLEYFPEPTLLIERADRVIAMGGYNTTCEILSFQKQAVIVPRIKPRQEQLVRAERLQAMGLLDVLHPDRLSVETLNEWLRQPDKPPASRDRLDLNGLTRIPQFLAVNVAPRFHTKSGY